MERLTTKELAPYLPYDLTVMGNINGIDTECCLTTWNIESHIQGQSKPLLRPLSQLTEEIEHNGERFVPYDVLRDMELKDMRLHSDGCLTVNHRNIQNCEYWRMEKLFEWHFDVFRLIDKCLALPIDGKEVEPLTCGYCDSKFSKGTGGNYGEYGDVCINCYEGLS
ncbi:hypothetical protein ACF3OC_08515 [Sphingobacterium cellulitidis]|uniref:hypothetical protein n=1 Tax=Sphingobacterium cellulitidis TaxID=1768011 RepID=UPI00370DAC31